MSIILYVEILIHGATNSLETFVFYSHVVEESQKVLEKTQRGVAISFSMLRFIVKSTLYSSIPASLTEQSILSPLKCSISIINQIVIYMYMYFCVFYSLPLVYFSNTVPMPHLITG